MAKFSTNGAGMHEANSLEVTWYSHLAEGAYVFRAMRADMLSGLALEASYHSGSDRFWVEDDDGDVACSGLHNHIQSSGEHNMSSAHSRSTLLVNPSPAMLSQCSCSLVERGGAALEQQGKGLVHQANWGRGLMAVSVEERELVGEEALEGQGEQGSVLV